MRIVSCGEAVVDFLPADASWSARAGGSPFNVAIGLARLGVATGFLGRLSTDLFGDKFVAQLEREQIATSLVTRSTDPSLLAFVDLTQTTPRYGFYGNGAADFGLTAAPGLPDTVRALHVGSLAWAMGSTAATLESLVAREFTRRLISFDPNPRPSLLGDAAAIRARFDRSLARAHIVKLSDEDLAFLLPGHTPDQAAELFVARGVLLAIVTRGTQDTIWRCAGGGGTTPIVATAVADTIGAGDSFTAGLLAALSARDLDSSTLLRAAPRELLAACIAEATRCASITCSRIGADPPHRRDLA
ncbi:carbohydrate kinase family protein [Roseiterribacter gracilis]|uniref:Carbohydrate kinase n=1 Tax=Roseiterribacter gracilis TaxID=2812848 RepID=A0A8S8XCT2_9PROT|nr:carbohydrate kinase [Rhodospirillales bacterium TMPK1]